MMYTLQAIWQKIFPEWPSWTIGLGVVFKMKMVAHCGANAKDVMVLFINRFRRSNSQQAASQKGPLTFERAENLAKNICGDKEYAREPLSLRGRGVQLQPEQQNGGDLAPRGRGGNTAGGEVGAEELLLEAGVVAKEEGSLPRL